MGLMCAASQGGHFHFNNYVLSELKKKNQASEFDNLNRKQYD